MHAAHTCTQRTHARSAHMHAAHTCTQRTHARSAHMHAHTRIKCDPSGACIRTLRVRFNEPGSEADRALRKRKNKPSHEDAPSVHPFKPHFVRSLARSATLTLTLRSAPRLRAPFGRKKKKKSIMAKGHGEVHPSEINRAMTLTPKAPSPPCLLT